MVNQKIKMTAENGSKSDAEPDPDSIYGQEVPSADEVEEELADAEPISSPPPSRPGEPRTEKTEDVQTATEPSNLEIALGGRDLGDILPQLSPEERELLTLRFDPASGQRLLSQREAAEQLGLELRVLREREYELMEQIHHLAGLPPPER